MRRATFSIIIDNAYCEVWLSDRLRVGERTRIGNRVCVNPREDMSTIVDGRRIRWAW